MLNNCVLMGRFTHTPKLETTVNNNKVVKFSLAVARSKATVNGEKQTDFIDCIAWNKTAEFVCKHFKKGEPIIVEGRLTIRQYDNKQGIKRKAYEVVVEEIYFCAFKRSDEQDMNLIENSGENLPF